MNLLDIGVGLIWRVSGVLLLKVLFFVYDGGFY